MIPKLTREQAAIIGAYTGICVGPFADIHAYAEKKLARPIFTHQFADSAIVDKLKQAAKEDFLALAAEPER